MSCRARGLLNLVKWMMTASRKVVWGAAMRIGASHRFDGVPFTIMPIPHNIHIDSPNWAKAILIRLRIHFQWGRKKVNWSFLCELEFLCGCSKNTASFGIHVSKFTFVSMLFEKKLSCTKFMVENYFGVMKITLSDYLVSIFHLMNFHHQSFEIVSELSWWWRTTKKRFHRQSAWVSAWKNSMIVRITNWIEHLVPISDLLFFIQRREF